MPRPSKLPAHPAHTYSNSSDSQRFGAGEGVLSVLTALHVETLSWVVGDGELRAPALSL